MIWVIILVIVMFLSNIAFTAVALWLLRRETKRDQSDYILAYGPGEPGKPPSPVMVRKPVRQKPGGIFADPVPSAVIPRPTAKQLNDWARQPEVREGEQAMRDSLASNPDIVRQKELAERLKKEKP